MREELLTSIFCLITYLCFACSAKADNIFASIFLCVVGITVFFTYPVILKRLNNRK